MAYITHISKWIFKHIKKLIKIFVYNFFLYIKMTNKYYQKQKEKLRKEARERYQNLSEEEKDKRQKKVWERFQNLPEEEKEKKSQYHRECNKNLSEE